MAVLTKFAITEIAMLEINYQANLMNGRIK